jgi:hypothetical protein
MLKLLVLSLLSIILVACQTNSLPKIITSSTDLTSAIGYSSVALVYYDHNSVGENHLKPYCTGVWIDQFHILTALHCVKVMQQIAFHNLTAENTHLPSLSQLHLHYVLWNEVAGVEQEPLAWHLTNVIAWDDAHDLALLLGPWQGAGWHSWASLGKHSPSLGSPITVLGMTHGYYWTFLQGWVSAYRGKIPGAEGIGFLQAQVPAHFGNSGGGAFNSAGELVGLADFILDIPDQTVFIDLTSLKQFLHHSLPASF